MAPDWLPSLDHSTILQIYDCPLEDQGCHGSSCLQDYNNLFEHLDGSIAQLQQKKVPWKQNMLTVLRAARQKLQGYYAKTEDMHGHLYAIGTILASDTKLRFFSGPKWEGNWRGTYRQSIEDYFEPYKQNRAETQESAQAQSSIDILLNGPSH
ncbi:hypothetical protein VN97_g13279 [Penicillium thymicola]|uniref:Uncharacterized protein n=1 Tax=Penicillium thymicola TaxID=293382 RepID=A0AAI9T487_PENTH|nr:hypothetical protein VN97_g13279 [Penicillium thymicola]